MLMLIPPLCLDLHTIPPTAIYNLALYPVMDSYDSRTRIFYIGVVVGIGNVLQWSLLTVTPIIQVSLL